MSSGSWKTVSETTTIEVVERVGWFERVVLRKPPVRNVLVTLSAHLDYIVHEGDPPELILDDNGSPTVRFTTGSRVFMRGIQLYEVGRQEL